MKRISLYIVLITILLGMPIVCKATLPRWTICNREYTERESTGLLRGLVITDTKEIVGNISCYDNKIVVVYYSFEEDEDERSQFESVYLLISSKPIIKYSEQLTKYEEYKATIKELNSGENIDCIVRFYPDINGFLFLFSDPHQLFFYYNEKE